MHGLITMPHTLVAPGQIEMDKGDETQRFMWRELPAVRSIATDFLLRVLEN